MEHKQPMISTPFDNIPHFEPNVLLIIDEYTDKVTIFSNPVMGQPNNLLRTFYLHWFVAYKLSYNYMDACKSACSVGDLEALKYLHSLDANNILNISSMTAHKPICLAAIYGHLEIVQYIVSMYQNTPTICTRSKDVVSYVLGTAAEHGQLHVVKYLVSQGGDIHFDNNYAIRMAVTEGHIDIVKYCVPSLLHISIIDEMIETAIRYEHTDIKEYLTLALAKRLGTLSNLLSYANSNQTFSR